MDTSDGCVRQRVSVFRMLLHPALRFQLTVQLLQVRGTDRGDFLFSKMWLDVVLCVCSVAVQRTRAGGGRGEVLQPSVQPLPQGQLAVFDQLRPVVYRDAAVQLVKKLPLGLRVDVPEDGRTVVLMSDDDTSFPAAIVALPDHTVTARSAF